MQFDLRDFAVNEELKVLSAEASTLGIPLGVVFRHFDIKDLTTGASALFLLESTEMPAKGKDFAGWRYKCNGSNQWKYIGYEVLIIND